MYRNSVRSGGALMWFLQRITGIYLAVVLFVHILLLHGLLEGELRFDSVASRVATPLWKTIDITFLVIALFHGLYGLWIVLDDYIHKGWMRVVLFSVISIVAVIFITLGILTILPFQAGGL